MANGYALRGLLRSKASVEFTEAQRSWRKVWAYTHLRDPQPVLLSLARPS